MPYIANVIEVLIASPGDVKEEREAAREIALDWNRKYTRRTKIVLQPRMWELDATPQLGSDPQEVVNEQLVETTDILVGILWTRLGSPTPRSRSGTVEEITKFLDSKRPGVLYFSSRQTDPHIIDFSQFQAVKDFRSEIQKKALCGQFSDLEDFKKQFSDHLDSTVHKYFKGAEDGQEAAIAAPSTRVPLIWRQGNRYPQMTPAEPQVNRYPPMTPAEPQVAFVATSRVRWDALTANLDPNAPERCPLGRYELDYALVGDFEEPNLSDLFDVLRQSCARGPGSSLLFQIPQQPELQPVPIGDCIECWLNMQAVARPIRDSPYCDFWRASPEGRMFLLRGYIEDSAWRLADLASRRIPEERNIEPGTTFDLSHTIWSVGECFVHAAKVASLLAPGRGDIRVHLQAQWYGLGGRRLASIGGNRDLFGNYVCRQDEYAAATIVEVSRIGDNLPEIVGPLIAPLYERFSFFRLSPTQVAEELATMKSRLF